MNANAAKPGSLLRAIMFVSAIAAVILVLTSSRLWFPHSPTAPFPQVPLIAAVADWPIAVDWVSSIGLLVGWLLIAWASAKSRPSSWRVDRAGGLMVLGCGTLLVVLNQHRFQPWHYQLILFAAVSMLGSQVQQITILRWLVVSVYFYSALSKIDFEFLHTVGQQFLAQILEFVHLENFGSYGARVILAWLFPLLELAIAIGLTQKAYRRLAGVAAVCLHLGLVLVLGPFGLNHSLGVVLWNVYFAVIAFLLFVWPDSQPAAQHLPSEAQPPPAYSKVLFVCAAIVMTLPIFERTGYWDHWPSWALYAPHSSRVEVQVAKTATDILPQELQELLQTPDESTIWVRVPMSEWSLETLGVPIYPQSRFQLGVARKLAEELDSEFTIRAKLLGPAARIDGKRKVRSLEGRTEIARVQDSFLFNTLPRSSQTSEALLPAGGRPD